MAVLADLLFQLSRHPDPVSHPDAPRQLYVPVAASGMRAELLPCKLKETDNALVRNVLCPVFLLFAHGGLIGYLLQIGAPAESFYLILTKYNIMLYWGQINGR